MKKITFLFLLILNIVYADTFNQCDILAADPYSKSNPNGINGVKFKNIDVEKALPACKKAFKDFPNIARYSYQLGRVYEKMKEYKKALEWFTKSANQGYNISQLELANMYYFGSGKMLKSDKKKAIYWYKKVAEQNNTSAQVQLAQMYLFGEGIKKDENKAFKWHMKAAQGGDYWGQAMVGNMYHHGDAVKQDYNKALKWYLKSTSQGKYNIAGEIASMYEKGEGTKKDYNRAFKWYLIHANDGSSSSAEKVGDMYRKGIGTTRNYKKALQWYLKANKLNKCVLKIGNMYENGEGVEKDYKLALDWYKKGIDWGSEISEKAIEKIVNMYNSGKYANKKDSIELAFTIARLYERKLENEEKAFKWYMKLAKQGYAVAQQNIGSYYEIGRGVKKDLEKAIKWYTKAAKKGDSISQYALGEIYYDKKDYTNAFKWLMLAVKNDSSFIYSAVPAFVKIGGMYYEGKGVGKNYQESFSWYMKAAKSECCNAYAQYSIGWMYYKGQGVKRNYILAYAWYNLASQNGFDASKYIDILEQKLTPSQIIVAQNYNPLKDFKTIKNEKITETSTGTSFFVNNNQVLTNYHVIKECKKIELIRQGFKSSATIYSTDEINDLAVLKTSKINNDFLYFRTGKALQVGDSSIVMGYPLGNLLGSSVKVTTGNISAMTGLLNNTARLQLTAPVQPGNSGGPLLDKSGNIIGVVVARLEKEQNVNLAIKANIVQVFLDLNKVKYDTKISNKKTDVASVVNKAKKSVIKVVCYK